MSKSSTTSSTAATAVEPQDYADSPVHYAVAIGDHTTITKLVSSLPKLTDHTRIQTESESLDQERLAEQISSVLDSRDNGLKETPLHIAVRLNDVAAARALAEAGANIYLQNAAGWNPLQEAIINRRLEIVPLLAQHSNIASWSKWRRRLPRIVAAVRRMRDFYMEISFHFESSIVPFFGKIAPSDTYKIWKRDGNLRADTSLAGYDGLNIKRSNHSFLFLNDINYNDKNDIDIPQGTLLILKHNKKKIQDAFENAGNPLSDAEISSYCNRTSVFRPGMDVSKAALIGRKNWRGQEKTENVGEWKAKVYEMHNVILSLRARKVNQAENRDDPFSPCTVDRTVAPPQNREQEFEKSLRPMVWLTEHFPLKIGELLPLLDILAKKLTAVRRMREVLRTTFPPGTFPVKVAIPVVPTVRVVITFTKFIELQPLEYFHTAPSSPRHVANVLGSEDESSSGDNRSYLSFSSSWLKGGNRHKQSSSSGGHAVDPFVIPSGYSWISSSRDEKSRKAK